MEDLYLVEENCVIKKRGDTFVVTKDGNKIFDIPYTKISKIFAIGSQSITPKAVEFALEKEIDIIFIGINGKIKGKITSTLSRNVFLRLSQYELWRNPNKRLILAKKFIVEKTINQYSLLRKNLGIGYVENNSVLRKIQEARSIDELMGYEGEVSRVYFSNFNKMLKGDITFNGRTRRPPKDEVNALLSLTYTITANHILSYIEKAGMDSTVGFLHSIKYSRESLALDILEEFRSVVCDNFVITLINRKEIGRRDFIKTEEGGYRLNEVAFRKYLEKYNERVKLKYSSIMEGQVSKVKKYILYGEKYTGFM